jgi:hypothetical protein
MKKIVFLLALSFTLVGCEDTYRYPCQDPANAEKAECNRPICEADGMCFDTLNGLPPKQAEEIVEAEEAATPTADCNCNTENTESTGE